MNLFSERRQGLMDFKKALGTAVVVLVVMFLVNRIPQIKAIVG